MKITLPANITIIAVIALFIFSCKTETEVYNNQFSKKYSNGQTIEVKREDIYKKYYGIISGINWNNNHSFHYEFLLKPDDSQWTGTDRQIPEKILFCEEGLYIKVSEERALIDTSDAAAAPIIVDTFLYYKNVDKRYFFKLFGKQYFESTDSLEYIKNLRHCKEENIPNK